LRDTVFSGREGFDDEATGVNGPTNISEENERVRERERKERANCTRETNSLLGG